MNKLILLRQSRTGKKLNAISEIGSVFSLCLFVFFLPFEEIVSFGGTSILFFLAIPLFFFCSSRILLGGFSMNKGLSLLPIITVWLFVFSISGINSPDQSYFFRLLKTYFLNILLFSTLLCVPFSQNEIRKISGTSVISGLTSFFVSVPLNERSMRMTGRITIDIFGTNLDQNWFCMILSMSLMASFYLFMKTKDFKLKIALALSACLISTNMFLCGSRTIVIVIGLSMLYFLFHIGVFLKKPKTALIVFASCLILGVAIFFVLPTSIKSRLSIANIIASMDEKGGRLEIWKSLVPHLFERPILGYGGGSDLYLTKLFYGRPKAIHNSYLASLITTGILGFVFYTGQLLSQFLFSLKKRNWISVVLSISIVVFAFFLDLQYTKMFWILSFYAILISDSCEMKGFTSKKVKI